MVSSKPDSTRLGRATVVVPGRPDAPHVYRQLLGYGGRVDPVVENGTLRVRNDSNLPRIVFECGDIDRTRKLLERRGLELMSADPSNGDVVAARHPAIGIGASAQRDTGIPHRLAYDVDRIDHVVFTAPDRVRAIALFGGVLGMDFRLAQQMHGVEQMFFRTTDVVVEVLAHGSASESEASGGISLWGVAWRSTDLDATRARLVDAGVEVSEIRAGRKPGTRVTTVHDDALGIATLVIEHLRQE